MGTRKKLPLLAILFLAMLSNGERFGHVAKARTIASVLAAQIRSQGFACDEAQKATRDAKLSKPDYEVCVLKCKNATYVYAEPHEIGDTRGQSVVVSFSEPGNKRNALPLGVAELREAVLERIPHIFLSVGVHWRKDANVIDGRRLGFGDIHVALNTQLSIARLIVQQPKRPAGMGRNTYILHQVHVACDRHPAALWNFRHPRSGHLTGGRHVSKVPEVEIRTLRDARL